MPRFKSDLVRKFEDWFAVDVLSRSATLRRKIEMGSEISSYFDWQLASFGPLKTVRTKLHLWNRMSERMQASGEPWHVIELGVAYGDATRWWLSHHERAVIATWDGFDRFTGLPRMWRGFPAGTCDAGGQAPAINDERIAWHVGDIENTIQTIDLDRIASGRRLVYFDCDIYEPSKVAWDWLRPHLRPGDIMYFDEAFDADERRLLVDSIVPAGNFDSIGTTAFQLAIEVRALN
jgi:hypothetical protein